MHILNSIIKREAFTNFSGKYRGSMEDKRNILFDEKPFGYKLIKDNKAIITYKGKAISTITGKDYNKLIRVIALDNIYELQLFLAKITGQFKHGNEKDNK